MNVFIQTPNLNAEPLLPALLEAVRRGVDVYYYVTLGYNDSVSQTSEQHLHRRTCLVYILNMLTDTG